MIDFEKEFLSSERMRERLQYAEHERMARDARRAAARTDRLDRPRRVGGWAVGLVRRLARATAT